MMPFVTEELYQRLPESPCKAESICVASYPQPVISWTNSRVEEQMETLKTVICGFRSQTAQLGMKPSARPKAYVTMSSEDDSRFITRVAQHVVTLAKLESLEVVSGKPESQSCVVSVLNERCTIYVDAEGLVDFKAEIDKFTKKRGLLLKSLEGLEKKMNLPGYEEKVPADVRTSNKEKFDDLNAQLTEMDSAMAMLRKAGGL
jgi:valyl-tRNA synthetase